MGATSLSQMRALVDGAQNVQTREKQQRTFTPDATNKIYGCCPVFEICGDNDLLSTVLVDNNLSNWIGFRPNNECKMHTKYVTWMGPQGTATNAPTHGAGAPCDDPYAVEWGKCERVQCKGLIRRCGQAIDITMLGEKYCEQQPIYRFDGQPITNDLDWQAVMAGMVLQQDLNYYLVMGNAMNAYEFDGLEQLVTTGVVDNILGTACPELDSQVYNWGSAAMASGVIDLVSAYIREIRRRAANLGGIAPGDMVLMMPSYLAHCFMESWVCYGICGEMAFGERWETRDRYNRYVGGGQFNQGYIEVDGVSVDILINDWEPMTQVAPRFCSDLYILTRRIGRIPTMYGVYQDMRQAVTATASNGADYYAYSDGGKFLLWSHMDNLCIDTCVMMKPALIAKAPWSLGRVDNICCSSHITPKLPNPWDINYGPGLSGAAVCSPSYIYGPC